MLLRLRAANVAALVLALIALRAVSVLLIACILVAHLPDTRLFESVTHWCLHSVIPFMTTEAAPDSHLLGAGALALPLAVSIFSIGIAGFGIWRGARKVQAWLRESARGEAPDGAVVVAAPRPMIGAAGLLVPRVVVSTQAVVAMDDAELAAGIEHERGHIARRHRYVLLTASLLSAVTRFVPGTRGLMELLEDELERDADEYAVARQGPLPLSSAICKLATAGSRTTSDPAFAGMDGGGTIRRLRALSWDRPRPLGFWGQGAALTGVFVISSAALALALQLPAEAASAAEQVAGMHAAHPEGCPH